MRSLISQEGLDGRIEVDSAGTGDWHVGAPPDRRATEAAARRGIVLSGTARQVRVADFRAFDLVLAMDSQNLRDLRAIAPAGTESRVRMLADIDVPDPYYGGADGFDVVLDLLEKSCRVLLDELRHV